MTVARARQGLHHPLDYYPVLRILRDREEAQRSRRRSRPDHAAAKRLAELEAQEGLALDDLRRVLEKHRAVTQDRVARRARVSRTMVNKVLNSGLPGRERQWTRSVRVIAATYRTLEAEGWSPVQKTPGP